jgi:uncharacterized protein (DUF1697 family)
VNVKPKPAATATAADAVAQSSLPVPRRARRKVGSMKTCIALVRGINVGGNRLVPMRVLAELVGELGASRVETYIQSGNLVFQIPGDDPQLGARIAARIEGRFGFAPKVLVLSVGELRRAVDGAPFEPPPEAQSSVQLLFLAREVAEPDRTRLDRIKAPSESWVLGERVFYLHAPEGLARSKLAVQAEKILGIDATARNLHTARELLKRAQQLEKLG